MENPVNTIVEVFKPEVFNFAMTVVAVLFLLIVRWAVAAFASTEQGRRVIHIWDILDDAIYDASITVFFGKYEEDEANKLVEEYKARFGKDLDPRIAFVVKQTELQIEPIAGFDFDFLAVLNRAERIYQERVKPKQEV